MQTEVTWSRYLPGVQLRGKHSGKKAQQMQRQGDRKVSIVFREPLTWCV